MTVEVDKVLANAPVGPQLYNITAVVPSGAYYTQVVAYGSGDWIKMDQWCVTTTAPATCYAIISGLKFNDMSGATTGVAITNGGTYNIDALPSSFNLEAIYSGTIESITFDVTGVATFSNTENTDPYNSPGTGTQWTYGPGTYTVVSKAYSGDGATGILCNTKTVTFTINPSVPCTLPIPNLGTPCLNPSNANPNFETSTTTVFNDNLGGVPASFITQTANNIGTGNTAFPTGYGFNSGNPAGNKAGFLGWFYLNSPGNKLMWGRGNGTCWGFANDNISLKNCTKYKLSIDVAGWTPPSTGGSPNGTTDFNIDAKFNGGPLVVLKSYSIPSTTNCNGVTFQRIEIEFYTGSNSNANGLQNVTLFVSANDANDGLLFDNMYVCEVGAASTLTAIPGICSNQQYTLNGTMAFSPSFTVPTTGTLTIAVAGGGSQVFNAPFTTPINYSIAGLSADGLSKTVTATFSDPLGYNATATFTANSAPALPTATKIDPSCTLATGSITITGPIATGMTYIVDGGNFTTILTYNGLASGNHTIVAKNASGCSGGTTTISLAPQPATPTLPTATKVNPTCTTATGSITITSPLASGMTYSLDGSAFTTTLTYNNLAAGNHTIVAKNAAGCSSGTTTINLPAQPVTPIAPTAFVTQPTCLVSTGSIALTNLPSGSWTLNRTGTSTATTTGSGTSFTISPISAGNYNFTVTNSLGCTSTALVNVIVNAQPRNQYHQQYPVAQPNCAGLTGTATITAPIGQTYAMDQSITFSTVLVYPNLAAGSTHTFYVKNTEGCISLPTTITIDNPTALVLNIDGKIDVTCFGGNNGSINLGVSGGTSPYTYSWTKAGLTAIMNTTQDPANLTAGTYTVVVTDAKNCTSTTTATIGTPQAALSSTNTKVDVNYFGGNTGSINLSVTGGTEAYTFSWTKTGGGYTASTEDISGLSAGTYNVTVTDSKGCTTTSAIEITQPLSALNLVASPTDVSCFGGSNGSIALTVTGGTSSYNFAWTKTGGGFASTLEDVTGLSIGTYTVVVTDSKGCTASTSATISQPIALSATLNTKIDVSCFGDANGSITINVNGGTPNYTYLWNNGAITKDFSGLPAGNYSVQVTDSKGCITNLNVTISQPSGPLTSTKTSSVDVSCFAGNNGSIDLTVGGGTSPYTYSWSKSGITGVYASTQDISSLPAGTYTVVVTDAKNCTSSTVIIISQPTAALTATITNKVDVNCFNGNTGSIDLSVTGGTINYTYAWSKVGSSFTASSQDLSGLNAGTYNVTITDSKGCSTTSNAIITQPSNPLLLTKTSVNISCFNGNNGSIDLTVSGGTPNYTYSWTKSGSSTVISTNQDLSNLIFGTYSVTVTDSKNCTETTTVTITQPEELILSETHIDVACNGGSNGSINLSVLGGTALYTYSWKKTGSSTVISTSEDLSGLTSGTYNVIVTDSKGCIKELSALISQNSGIQIEGTITDVNCFGESNGAINVTVTGGVAPYTYDWGSGFATIEDRTNLPAGSYTLIVKDNTSGATCTTSKTFLINQPLELKLSATKQNVECNGKSTGSIDLSVIGGTPNYTYVWTKNGNNVGDTQDLSMITAGTYSVIVTDSHGCSKTINVTITEPAPGSIGNYTFIDSHANGIQDDGDLPIDGISVKLYNATSNGSPIGDPIATTTSANGGFYNFPNICAGNYVIEFGTKSGFIRTIQSNTGSKDETDSDANPTTGFTGLITLQPGENDPTNDAGFYASAQLGNFVWDDKNANGIQDINEPGIVGATVNLSNGLTTITDGNGAYSFANLTPGTYSVTFVKPLGFTNASPTGQGTTATDSNADVSTGQTSPVILYCFNNSEFKI